MRRWFWVVAVVLVGVWACSGTDSDEPASGGSGGQAAGAAGGRAGAGGQSAAGTNTGGQSAAGEGAIGGAGGSTAGIGPGGAAGAHAEGGAAGAHPEGGAPTAPDYCGIDGEGGALDNGRGGPLGDGGDGPLGDDAGTTQAELVGTWHFLDGGGEDIYLEIRADGTGTYTIAFSDMYGYGEQDWEGLAEVGSTVITLQAGTVTNTLGSRAMVPRATMLPPQTLRFRYLYDAHSDTLYLSDPNCDRSFQQNVGYYEGTVALKRVT